MRAGGGLKGQSRRARSKSATALHSRRRTRRLRTLCASRPRTTATDRFCSIRAQQRRCCGRCWPTTTPAPATDLASINKRLNSVSRAAAVDSEKACSSELGSSPPFWATSLEFVQRTVGLSPPSCFCSTSWFFAHPGPLARRRPDPGRHGGSSASRSIKSSGNNGIEGGRCSFWGGCWGGCASLVLDIGMLGPVQTRRSPSFKFGPKLLRVRSAHSFMPRGPVPLGRAPRSSL